MTRKKGVRFKEDEEEDNKRHMSMWRNKLRNEKFGPLNEWYQDGGARVLTELKPTQAILHDDMKCRKIAESAEAH